jgi:hypothetical protein
MSAILTSGAAPGKQSLQALLGLRTETLYFFPRPAHGRRFFKRAIHPIKTIRTKPLFLNCKLMPLPDRYQRFLDPGWDYYQTLVKRLCDHSGPIVETIERKQPSTGIVALAIGISLGKYDRLILSGFSFELTHAYGKNPGIDKRGTLVSNHADTDVAVTRYLSEKYRTIFTTERTVNERTGIPLFTDIGS